MNKQTQSVKIIFTMAILSLIILTGCSKDTEDVVSPPIESNWHHQISNVTNNLKDIYFVDSLTGYAAGNSAPNDTNKLLKTTDGGLNWFRKPVGVTNASLTALYFFDGLTGFAAGSNAAIIKTLDGGTTWGLCAVSVTSYLFDIEFFDNQNGLACGINGKILRTSNFGDTWQEALTPNLAELYSISMPPFTTGEAYVSGEYGTMLYTNNYGLSWQQQNTGVTNHLKSVCFTDPDSGYVCGNNGTILRTTNKGVNWSVVSSGQTTVLNSVFFVDSRTGYIAVMEA